MADPPPPPHDDRVAHAPLREALAEAGYTHEGFERALGRFAPSPAPAERPLAERHLPEGPLATLIRLFVLEGEVGRADAEAALGALGVEGAARLRLVVEADGRVSSPIRLLPSGDVVFASDYRGGRASVMGVAPSSALLGNLTLRRPVDRALDVGTGSGIQALLAARHSGHVVATDVSERALAFAAFNAALNGFDNVEFRQGDFFEPAAGERFGLVVSNPPFVVSPDADFVYRDAGLPGDAVSRLAARETAAHLAEGGHGHVLVTWAHGEEQADWSAPVRAWTEGTGCDALLLRYSTDDPLAYAERWNPPAQAEGRAELGETVDRWVAYCRELGIEALSYGALTLRRRDGEPWVAAEDAPPRIAPADGHVERLIAAQDFLAGGRDLLYERLVLVEEHALEQALHLDEGVFGVQAAAIRLTEGLGFQAEIDVWTAQIVASLDGRRTVREAIAETAGTLGAGDIGAEDLGRAALSPLRRMVELGFLVPPDR